MTDLRQHFADRGQGHVFAHFDKLSPPEQEDLLGQAASLDLDELDKLYRSLVLGEGAAAAAPNEELEPADYIPLPGHEDSAHPSQWREAFLKGEAALRSGRVAAFTVAGGQGTRLGFDGPKGSFGVSPVLRKSLFQIFAEKLLLASRIYGRAVPWYLMTSVINHEETLAFFEAQDYFGLDRERVHFITQGCMPAIDAQGRILLSDQSHIALSPDGHGGSLRALVRSGAIAAMEAEGIDTISYFQVDNPLVNCLDPAFIGFHLLRESEFSSKMVPKAYPEEKVGIFCQRQGQLRVVEYSDLPAELATATLPDGRLRFAAANIAVHLFDRDFVARLGQGGEQDALPFHLAHKKIPYLDEAGVLHEPGEPNGYKFEMFVFDALRFARNPLIVESERAVEFSPVKNAEGPDSPQTCRDDQLRLFARWAKAAGLAVETDETGRPGLAFEVSPLFADSETRFVQAWQSLPHKPVLTDGLVLV